MPVDWEHNLKYNLIKNSEIQKYGKSEKEIMRYDNNDDSNS